MSNTIPNGVALKRYLNERTFNWLYKLAVLALLTYFVYKVTSWSSYYGGSLDVSVSGTVDTRAK